MGKQFKDRIERRMVKVTDGWCPNYNNDEICLSISLQSYKPYSKAREKRTMYGVKISAHGMDDKCVALEYEVEGMPELAEARYDFWKNYIYDRVPDGINMEWFYEHGFTRI